MRFVGATGTQSERKESKMNHKAEGTCPDGHKVKWGSCEVEVQKRFGGTKKCGSCLFEQIYADGTKLTVSFDDRKWNAVQCKKCETVFENKDCPECGKAIPASEFKKKGLWAKLG